MRVLLISPNVEFLPDPVFPIGLAYLAALLKKKDIPHQVLDLCFAEDYESATRSALIGFQPDVVGLSLRNLDNVSFPNYISYLPFYRQVVRTVRKHSRAVVVLGGSGFTLMPDRILNDLEGDFGIVGEGEASFIRLLDHLEDDRDGRSLGLGRVLRQPEITEDLDSIPHPDWSAFDHEAYMKWGGMGNIQTKRGCPFECIYCTYPLIEGKTVRLRNPGRVCDELEEMLDLGLSTVFFVDNAFNYPLHHGEAICREIIDRNLTVNWSCYVNPRFMTRRLSGLMVSSGCTSVEFGSDAADEMMLANLGKGFTLEDLRRASILCRDVGLSFCHSVLLGGPGETMETVKRSLEAIREMSPTAVICMVGIRVFPNTRLHALALKEGLIDPEQSSLEPLFYLSPAVRDEILPWIKAFSKENSSWIFPGLNINMDVKLQKKLRRFGIKGPLWEHMKVGERMRKRRRGHLSENPFTG